MRSLIWASKRGIGPDVGGWSESDVLLGGMSEEDDMLSRLSLGE